MTPAQHRAAEGLGIARTPEERVAVIIDCRPDGQVIDCGHLAATLAHGRNRVLMTRGAYEHAKTLADTDDDRAMFRAAKDLEAKRRAKHLAKMLEGCQPHDVPLLTEQARMAWTDSPEATFRALTDGRDLPPFASVELESDEVLPPELPADVRAEQSRELQNATAIGRAVANAVRDALNTPTKTK